jgi:hypothetical protein
MHTQTHINTNNKKEENKNENKSCKLYCFDIFYLKNIIKKKRTSKFRLRLLLLFKTMCVCYFYK